jgi:hypothetical protein
MSDKNIIELGPLTIEYSQLLRAVRFELGEGLSKMTKTWTEPVEPEQWEQIKKAASPKVMQPVNMKMEPVFNIIALGPTQEPPKEPCRCEDGSQCMNDLGLKLSLGYFCKRDKPSKKPCDCPPGSPCLDRRGALNDKHYCQNFPQ